MRAAAVVPCEVRLCGSGDRPLRLVRWPRYQAGAAEVILVRAEVLLGAEYSTGGARSLTPSGHPGPTQHLEYEKGPVEARSRRAGGGLWRPQEHLLGWCP